MKLYNRTKYPDDLLQAVVAGATRFTGITHGQLLVQVNYGRAGGGLAWNACLVRVGKRWIRCDGNIVLRVPNHYLQPRTGLYIAENFFDAATHECCHIADYREGKMIQHRDGVTWVKQPGEIAVFNRLYDLGIEQAHSCIPFHEQVALPQKTQDAILDLALWIDENYDERTRIIGQIKSRGISQ